MAADTLGSYGSLARFRDVERLCSVGDRTLVGASGDIADFHAIKHMLGDIECVSAHCLCSLKPAPGFLAAPAVCVLTGAPRCPLQDAERRVG